jgi:hypothetical protein
MTLQLLQPARVRLLKVFLMSRELCDSGYGGSDEVLGRREFLGLCGRSAAVGIPAIMMLTSLSSDAFAGPPAGKGPPPKVVETKEAKREAKQEQRESKKGTTVPEIDAMSGGAALAIVGAAVALIRERSRR